MRLGFPHLFSQKESQLGNQSRQGYLHLPQSGKQEPSSDKIMTGPAQALVDESSCLTWSQNHTTCVLSKPSNPLPCDLTPEIQTEGRKWQRQNKLQTKAYLPNLYLQSQETRISLSANPHEKHKVTCDVHWPCQSSRPPTYWRGRGQAEAAKRDPLPGKDFGCMNHQSLQALILSKMRIPIPKSSLRLFFFLNKRKSWPTPQKMFTEELRL